MIVVLEASREQLEDTDLLVAHGEFNSLVDYHFLVVNLPVTMRLVNLVAMHLDHCP
jgi:hypothetical protein